MSLIPTASVKYVFLSPHFPPWFQHYIEKMKQAGVVVLGIGDQPWAGLSPSLKSNLKEYYHVANMLDYDQLYRAMGHLIHNHGRIHFVESLNEFWLETEGQLRDDFNIPGYKFTEVSEYKKKSFMKQVFREAGLDAAKGTYPHTIEEALAFARATGYPLVAKPDVGVGAEGATKVNTDAELVQVWRPEHRFYLEEFISGIIETYDGLVDAEGNIIFDCSITYNSGIMEIVKNHTEMVLSHRTKREIPADLRAAGAKAVAAFRCRLRFFHLEFFRTSQNRLLPLEMNLRPPGGRSIDMWNWGNDTDIFDAYVKLVQGQKVPRFPMSAPYYTCSAPRRDHWRYKHSHEEVLALLGARLRCYDEIPKVFSLVMGDRAYWFVTPDEAEAQRITQFIQERI
eukprot:TRINITY_DN2134_c0_g1_i1.p1 TRINITY_DN2134_c0_g1~~TRINITY_DN2134_c0_g1_i1.p1  ORF type:complete len:396 (-),score=98.22 TRINITY_DN2134_c0_g1_i1:64-1251(-)